LPHERDDQNNSEGFTSRDIPRYDREPDAAEGDARRNRAAPKAAFVIRNTRSVERRETDASLIAISTQFSGPLPPASMLREYDELVPGTAAALLEAHLAKESATTEALTRLTRAESTAVRVGTWGSVIVAVVGITMGLTLIALQQNLIAIAALIPGILAAITGLVAEIKTNSRMP